MKQTFCGRSFFVLCIFALSQVGCSYAIDKNNAQETPDQSATALGVGVSYQTVHDRVFAPRCIQCHGNSGGVNLESYNSVFQNLDRIQRAVFLQKTMPKGSGLRSDESSLLRKWIEDGAPLNASVNDGAPPTPPANPVSPPPVSSPKQDEIDFRLVKQEVLVPKCIGCHGRGAKISLDSYDQVKTRLSEIIRLVLITKTMPKATSLSQSQYDLLLNWIGLGAPETSKKQSSVPGKQTPPGSDDGGAGPGSGATEPSLTPSYESIKSNIFSRRCVSCHSSSGPAAQVVLTNREALLTSPRELVLPGNPDESGLVIAVERTDSKRMPPPDSGGALTGEEIKTIREWIKNGAKD
jgi:uncharacterized membrane protein